MSALVSVCTEIDVETANKLFRSEFQGQISNKGLSESPWVQKAI